MNERKTYQLDGDINKRSDEGLIFLLKQGREIHFEPYSDEFMREYLNDEDYAFWLQKKTESEALR